MPEERMAIAVAGAFAVAALVLALVWRPWRAAGAEHAFGRMSTAAALVAGAFLAVAWNRRSLPEWPPRGGDGTLLWILVAALPLAALEQGGARSLGTRAGAMAFAGWSLLALVLVARSVLGVRAGHGWSELQTGGVLVGSSAALLGLRLATGAALGRLAYGVVAALAWAIVLGATGFALAQTGSLSQAALGLGASAACAAVFVLGAWRRRSTPLAGSAGILSMLHGGLLLIGLLYVPGFRWPVALLLLAAPMIALAPIGKAPSWNAIVARGLLTAVVAGWAAWLSLPDSAYG